MPCCRLPCYLEPISQLNGGVLVVVEDLHKSDLSFPCLKSHYCRDQLFNVCTAMIRSKVHSCEGENIVPPVNIDTHTSPTHMQLSDLTQLAVVCLSWAEQARLGQKHFSASEEPQGPCWEIYSKLLTYWFLLRQNETVVLSHVLWKRALGTPQALKVTRIRFLCWIMIWENLLSNRLGRLLCVGGLLARLISSKNLC